MEDRLPRVRTFFDRGYYHYQRANFQEAVAHFQEALELYPAHVLARLHLAAATARLKHYDAALRILDAGLREPSCDCESQIRILRMAATINMGMGNYARARSLLDECIQLKRDDVQLWNQIGAVSLKSGNYQEGFEAYLEAVKLSAQD